MKNRKYDPLIALFLLIAVSLSCVTFFSGGFGIETFDSVNGTNVTAPNTSIGGGWDSSQGTPTTTSDRTQIFVTTGSDGRAYISDGRSPAVWRFWWNSGPCRNSPNNSTKLWVHPDQYTPLICIPRRSFFFNFAPEDVNVQSPPATFSLSGEGGLDTTYGMPLIEFYDVGGYWVGSARASAVSPDGTWLQATMPDLSACYNGGHGVLVSNVIEDGSFQAIGNAGLDIVGGSDPPPPPPDEGCHHDGTCAEWDDINCVCLRN